MADATSTKILQLLRPGAAAELRAAAALVLGEAGVRDKQAERALCAAVDDPDPSFRLQVLRAIGKLKIEPALPRLLAKVNEGGPEAEAAAQAAACLGAKGTRGLRELMARTAPGLRRRIAAALAAGGSASAETAAVNALLDNDPGVVDAVTRSLSDKIPTLSKDHRRALVEQIVEMLRDAKRNRLPLVSEAALLRLLSALGDARGEAAFWARVDGRQPPELRSAALQALGTLPAPSGTDKIKRLLACAADADFRVAAPALMILKSVSVSARSLKDWLVLLDAPDPAARRFAVDKVGDKDTADVGKALVRQLQHSDRSLREAALACLARRKSGREALVGALLEAKTPDEAWSLARAQESFVGDQADALRDKIFTCAGTFLEAGDRRADALLHLLRAADARGLRDRLEAQALALRKKKNHARALVYLRLLTRDPACGEAVRFEQAACALKVSSHDLAADARAADPCLGQFAGLIHRHETAPADYIEKAKWLAPEDLFYLGFHFAEGKGPEQEFGGQVLRLLVRRAPNAKQAKDAKRKLKSAGLG